MGERATMLESLCPTVQPAVTAPLALHYEVEQFLYFEAALLDEWRFREWWILSPRTSLRPDDQRPGPDPGSPQGRAAAPDLHLQRG